MRCEVWFSILVGVVSRLWFRYILFNRFEENLHHLKEHQLKFGDVNIPRFYARVMLFWILKFQTLKTTHIPRLSYCKWWLLWMYTKSSEFLKCAAVSQITSIPLASQREHKINVERLDGWSPSCVLSMFILSKLLCYSAFSAYIYVGIGEGANVIFKQGSHTIR